MADPEVMRDNRSSVGLERLGVLIGRTRSRITGERMFLVLGNDQGPRVPQTMIETQEITIVRCSDPAIA